MRTDKNQCEAVFGRASLGLLLCESRSLKFGLHLPYAKTASVLSFHGRRAPPACTVWCGSAAGARAGAVREPHQTRPDNLSQVCISGTTRAGPPACLSSIGMYLGVRASMRACMYVRTHARMKAIRTVLESSRTVQSAPAIRRGPTIRTGS